MKQRHIPPWIWGFCWAMIPAAITALALGSKVEPTHAIGQARKGTESASMSALHTRDALRADTKVLHTGQLVEGDEVDAQVMIRNVWNRKLSLEVALSGLPGWQAALESAVLKPGEATLLHLSGIAGEPGELDGKVRITALHDFLKVQVSVKGQIAPRPAPEPATEPATERAARPDVPTGETGPLPNEDQLAPEPDVKFELMPRMPEPANSSGEG